jgi:multidrug efflux system membrane fusion protein
MSKNLISASIVATLLVLWMGSGAFVSDTHATQPSTIPGVPDKRDERDERDESATLSRVRVAVNTAEPRTRKAVLRGRTEAKRAVEVTAEIAGQVVSVPVERGTQVAKGELLCEIAVDDREVAVQEARAGFEQARIEHAGSLKLAGQGLMSEVAIATSEARQEAARAHLHRQILNLERTRITAPFDGVIENLHLNTGDYAMPGASCATLIDLDPMLVVAHVTEEEVGMLQTGSVVSGSTRMGRAVEGQLSFIGKQSDPVTRTYPVEITVANGDYRLRSGLTVSVRAALDRVPAHRISPSLLTLNDDGAMGVRTLDESNRVVFSAVEILEDGPDGLWITGLPGTVNLITVGQEYVTVGERVEPVYDAASTSQIAAR